MTVTRRELLAAGAWALLTRPALHLRPTQEDLSAWLREFVDSANVASLAAAYRRNHPDQTAEQVRARVLSGKRAGESLADHLNRKVRDDFVGGRFEMLEGWILSKTEGELINLAI